MAAGLCADAWEKVSGFTDQRRSRVVSLIRQVHDPRPPVIIGTPWELIWASRRNGAGLVSARLLSPRLDSGDVAGFILWRANEAAVLDLAITEEFGSATNGADVLATILNERDMKVRLSQIQGLVERHLWKPRFLRAFVNLFEAADTKLQAGDCYLSISGAQTSLEFAMISAISRSGVVSDKLLLQTLSAIAIPQPRLSEHPVLHVVTRDLTGMFAISGLCVAIVGVPEGYSADDVRIFWSARDDIDDSSQLMTRLTPIKILRRSEALKYVPEIDDLCDRLAMANAYIYLMRPPQTWSRQSWSADLLKANAKVPAEQVAGPRSSLLRCSIVPSRGPELRIEERQPSTGGTKWIVSFLGLFQRIAAGLWTLRISYRGG